VKKRLFTIIMCLLLIMQPASVALASEAGSGSLAPVIRSNPLYPDRTVISARYSSAGDSISGDYPLSSYTADFDDAAATLRSGLEARDAVITVLYASPTEISDAFLDELMDRALDETGKPTQGDYLAYHWTTMRAAAITPCKRAHITMSLSSICVTTPVSSRRRLWMMPWRLL